ncbi:MAG: hypothetical protein ACRDRS_11515, partial [Pseudonocardiaceae bacterium]
PTPACPLTNRREITMLTNQTWRSLGHGKPLVPSRWQATVDSAAPDSLRHRVASAASEAAGFAAWLWYDLGDQYTMSHCYRQAGLAADESSNAGLRAYILGYQGLVARAQGQPESALGLFDQACQTVERSAADSTRSWLTVLAADALARVGRPREALAALDTARSLLAGQDSRRLTLASLETFAARGSVAGLGRVRELRETFWARGHVSAVAAIDEWARALGAVSG